MQALVRTLQHLKRIEELKLGPNALSSIGLIGLSGLVSHLHGLRQLDYTHSINLPPGELHNAGLGAASVELAEALSGKTRLVHLVLTRNVDFGQQGGHRDFIQTRGHSSSETCRLMGELTPNSGAVAMANTISSCTQLMHLDLRGTRTGHDGLAVWLISIGSLRFLRHLDLSDVVAVQQQQGPSSSCMAAPMMLDGSALAQLVALTFLSLSSNSLLPAFALSLGPSLRVLRQLEEINLSHNAFGDTAVVDLVSHLSGLRRLRILDVSDNGVQSKELTHAELTRCTKHMTGLRLIDQDSDVEDYYDYYDEMYGEDGELEEDPWWDEDGLDEGMDDEEMDDGE